MRCYNKKTNKKEQTANKQKTKQQTQKDISQLKDDHSQLPIPLLAKPSTASLAKHFTREKERLSFEANSNATLLISAIRMGKQQNEKPI